MSTLNPTTSPPAQSVAEHDRLPVAHRRPAAARTVRDVRIPYLRWIVAGLCLITAAWLLISARHFGFYGDEWDFVTRADHWTLADYFRPHNEHWLTIPTITYSLLFAIFGTTSYVPFMVPLVAAHVGAAVLLFLIVRPRAGDLAALGGTAIVLVVAAGSENLVWAFQVSFVGSLAFGLLTIYLLDRVPLGRLPATPAPAEDDEDDEDDEDGRLFDIPVLRRLRVRWDDVRPRLGTAEPGRNAAVGAAAALLASLACSGVGLFMLVTVATLLLLDRRRWRLLWILAPGVLAYTVWYLTVGATKLEVHRSPYSIEAFRELFGYVPTGIGAGFAGTVSLSPVFWGVQALAAGSAALALALYRNRLTRALPIAATVGLVLQFSLTGLVRAQLGDGQAAASRYLYIVAFFVVLMFAEAASDLPWRGLWRIAVVAALVLVTLHNVVVLQRNLNDHSESMDELEASLQTAWLIRDSPDWLAQVPPEPQQAPTLSAASYVKARTRLGSPYPEPTVEGVDALNSKGVNRAVRNLLPLNITPSTAEVDGLVCEQVGALGTVDAPPVKVVGVNDRSVVTVAPHAAGTLFMGQWVVGEQMDDPLAPVVVRGGDAVTVRIRSSGVGLPRHLAIQIPPGVAATVCVGNSA